MLFQKEMRLPIHNAVEPQNDVDESEEDPGALIEALLTAREQAFSKAKENTTAAQKKQKETYDRKHQSQVIAVGTHVLTDQQLSQTKLTACHLKDSDYWVEDL